MGIPLAERMRPQRLEDVVGQESLVGPKGLLSHMLAGGNVVPFILWGPPGVGKTTIARLIAQELKRPMYTLSAVHSGVKEVREVLNKATERSLFQASEAPILFIDEIHRFNKSQQDSLLPAVERGDIVLIGATTENPSFEVNSALLSRCQVFTLEPLDHAALEAVMQRAITYDPLLSQVQFNIVETESLYGCARGDGRRLLNVLELLYNARLGEQVLVNNNSVEQVLESSPTYYDKQGEMHYDCISAFIKSVRGSAPQAAVYYLARMLAGGEDPVFIARRLVILASEDIGLANPNALLLATAAMQAVNMIGMPEARIILSQVTLYLAMAAKSNSAYTAINQARDFVQQDNVVRSIPLHIRNAPTRLMRNLGYGANYQYAHDYAGNFVLEQYLPKGLEEMVFYNPQNNPSELRMAEHMKALWGNVWGQYEEQSKNKLNEK